MAWTDDKQKLARLQAIVDEQAEDMNLWRVVDASLVEEYLQAALRRLHAAIEEISR